MLGPLESGRSGAVTTTVWRVSDHGRTPLPRYEKHHPCTACGLFSLTISRNPEMGTGIISSNLKVRCLHDVECHNDRLQVGIVLWSRVLENCISLWRGRIHEIKTSSESSLRDQKLLFRSQIDILEIGEVATGSIQKSSKKSVPTRTR